MPALSPRLAGVLERSAAMEAALRANIEALTRELGLPAFARLPEAAAAGYGRGGSSTCFSAASRSSAETPAGGGTRTESLPIVAANRAGSTDIDSAQTASSSAASRASADMLDIESPMGGVATPMVDADGAGLQRPAPPADLCPLRHLRPLSVISGLDTRENDRGHGACLRARGSGSAP